MSDLHFPRGMAPSFMLFTSAIGTIYSTSLAGIAHGQLLLLAAFPAIFMHFCDCMCYKADPLEKVFHRIGRWLYGLVVLPLLIYPHRRFK